jgi:hypothetical protein
MTSLGVVANGDKETVIEAIALLNKIPGLKIIFIKQSDERLFIVTDRVFNIVNKGDGP